MVYCISGLQSDIFIPTQLQFAFITDIIRTMASYPENVGIKAMEIYVPAQVLQLFIV